MHDPSPSERREIAEGALRAIEAIVAEVEIPGVALSCGLHGGLPYVRAAVLAGRSAHAAQAFLHSRRRALHPFDLQVDRIVHAALEAASDAFSRATLRGVTYRGRPWPGAS